MPSYDDSFSPPAPVVRANIRNPRNGTRSTTDEVRAELSLMGRTFQGWFLLTGDQVGILGRDIMNGVALLLDGPRLTWDLSVVSDE